MEYTKFQLKFVILWGNSLIDNYQKLCIYLKVKSHLRCDENVRIFVFNA